MEYHPQSIDFELDIRELLCNFHAALFAQTKAALEFDEFIAAHRVSSTDFTRRRTLTFGTLVASLACGMLRSLQGELDDFFGRLANQANLVRAVSKSAFSQET